VPFTPRAAAGRAFGRAVDARPRADVDRRRHPQRNARGGVNAVQTRRESLRELLLARALYRCGDYQGVGKRILESYTHDLRGHLARHAQAVLEAGGGATPSRPR
jgi:hypothetical protein